MVRILYHLVMVRILYHLVMVRILYHLVMVRISYHLVMVRRDGDLGNTLGFSFSNGSHPCACNRIYMFVFVHHAI